MLRCNFCGLEFRSLAALRGHLRGCKCRPEPIVTSVRIANKLDWLRFKEFCRRHGLTTCHVINMVVKALPMVEQTGVRFEVRDGKLNISGVQGSNPIVFNFNVSEFFGAKPRGRGKYDAGRVASTVASLPSVVCLHLGGVHGCEVYCMRSGGVWIPISKCVKCAANRARSGADEVKATDSA